MLITVAGAGAGKTTKMASRILDINVPVGKVVFCVAFTNAAADNIKSKLIKENGVMPDGIRVSTIHSFLYTELVQPYYHLLYGYRYKKISTIDLPPQPPYRRKEISELENNRLLHQTVIPERAKWVIHRKSKDTAQIKAMRAKIVAMFAGYCHKIIVDEAQDIDKDIYDVLIALDNVGVDVELYGDPKQDVKGHKCFRKLIDIYPHDVVYSSECHRSPQLHLDISNRLADIKEYQIADEDSCTGSITVLFENETDISTLIASGQFGLAYISRKNERFDTHVSFDDGNRFNTLRHHLDMAIKSKYGNDASDLEIKRVAHYTAKQMIAYVDGGAAINAVINKAIDDGCFDFERMRYAKIAESLKVSNQSGPGAIPVKSIEAIKGLEDKECLFILTTDLVPYLLGDKDDDNKNKHLLYVALTRSRDNLTVLVTKEVDSRYPRDRILNAFGPTVS